LGLNASHDPSLLTPLISDSYVSSATPLSFAYGALYKYLIIFAAMRHEVGVAGNLLPSVTASVRRLSAHRLSANLNIFIHHQHGRKIRIRNENTISTT